MADGKTFRRVLGIMGLAISTIAVCGAQSPLDNLTPEQIMARSTTELAPGLYSFGSFGERSIFVVTDAGVIATDPTNSEHAAAMRAAIAGITDQPVRYVVYSHWAGAS